MCRAQRHRLPSEALLIILPPTARQQSVQLTKLPCLPRASWQHHSMERITPCLTRSTVGLFRLVPEFLDALEGNDRICAACHGAFHNDGFMAVLGCCNFPQHLSCMVNWLEPPLPPPGHRLPQYTTCLRCTARWNRRIVGGASLLGTISGIDPPRVGLGRIFRIEAGIPPANCSLTEAVKDYGRSGLIVLLSEIVGIDSGPLGREDAQQLLDTMVEQLYQRVQHDRKAQGSV